MFLKVSFISGRSDSFLAFFLPFIFSALESNLRVDGKISAEEVQFNGKSRFIKFQPEFPVTASKC